jgi:peptidoglycan/LPS O-acetylase OafA/YrhL
VVRIAIIWMGRLLVVLLALGLGFFGLSLLFVDPLPDQPALQLAAMHVAYFLIAGLIIGVLYPGGWFLAGAAAWGGVLLGVVALMASITSSTPGGGPFGLPAAVGAGVLIALPLALTLAGGYAGARLRRRLVRRA